MIIHINIERQRRIFHLDISRIDSYSSFGIYGKHEMKNSIMVETSHQWIQQIYLALKECNAWFLDNEETDPGDSVTELIPRNLPRPTYIYLQSRWIMEQ